jgi:hypothetical protein
VGQWMTGKVHIGCSARVAGVHTTGSPTHRPPHRSHDREQIHGQGRYCYFGNEYEGGFENGNKSGQGIHLYNTGDVYEGTWANDMQRTRIASTNATTQRVHLRLSILSLSQTGRAR